MEKVSVNCDMTLIGQLYSDNYHDLKQYVLGYTHDEMRAEDMIQNLFIKVMTLDTLKSETARSLLFVMANRMIVDDARHRAFVKRLHDGVRLTMSESCPATAVERITCGQIESYEMQHLQAMPPQRALVYKMWRRDDMTVGNIAKTLNLSRRTVENHLYLSRKEMKDYLRRVI